MAGGLETPVGEKPLGGPDGMSGGFGSKVVLPGSIPDEQKQINLKRK